MEVKHFCANLLACSAAWDASVSYAPGSTSPERRLPMGSVRTTYQLARQLLLGPKPSIVCRLTLAHRGVLASLSPKYAIQQHVTVSWRYRRHVEADVPTQEIPRPGWSDRPGVLAAWTMVVRAWSPAACPADVTDHPELGSSRAEMLACNELASYPATYQWR